MNTVAIISLISPLIILINADSTPPPSTDRRRCYVCTSAMHEGCGDSFNGSSKFPHGDNLQAGIPKLFLTYCDEKGAYPITEEGKEPPKAVGCRKILQEVGKDTRVVRQCAYGGEDVNGLKRTGNLGVRLFYYQCHENLCNGAVPNTAFWLFSLFLPIALVVAARW